MLTNGERFRHLTDQAKLARMTIVLSHSMRDRPFQKCFHYSAELPSALHPILPSPLSGLSYLEAGTRDRRKVVGGRGI